MGYKKQFANTAERSLYLGPYIEAECNEVKQSSYDSNSSPWTCYDYCMVDVLSSASVVNMMFLLKELSSRNKTRKHHILKHGILIKRVMKMRICILIPTKAPPTEGEPISMTPTWSATESVSARTSTISISSIKFYLVFFYFLKF